MNGVTQKDIEKMRARKLPHAEPLPGDGPPVPELAEYLIAFLPPRVDCVFCGARLLGIFGSFRWGLQNGEGYCSKCCWPARAIHRIQPMDGSAAIVVESLLQYHPDVIESKKVFG